MSGTGVDVNPKLGNNVAIGPGPGPGNSVVVGLVGTRQAGTMPSTWRFVAIPDPESEVFEGGIIIGHGEIGDDIVFVEESLPECYMGSLEGGFQHFDGFSEVTAYLTVVDSQDMGVPNASIDLRFHLLDDTTLEQMSVQTDESGNAMATFTIFNYGSYSVSVENINAEGYTYNPEMNATSSVTVEVD